MQDPLHVFVNHMNVHCATTPSTPLKEIWQKPQGPPSCISSYCLCMIPSLGTQLWGLQLPINNNNPFFLIRNFFQRGITILQMNEIVFKSVV